MQRITVSTPKTIEYRGDSKRKYSQLRVRQVHKLNQGATNGWRIVWFTTLAGRLEVITAEAAFMPVMGVARDFSLTGLTPRI